MPPTYTTINIGSLVTHSFFRVLIPQKMGVEIDVRLKGDTYAFFIHFFFMIDIAIFITVSFPIFLSSIHFFTS